MAIKHLIVLNGYPQTFAVPKKHHIKIYESDQNYFFQLIPDIRLQNQGLEDVRYVVGLHMEVYLDGEYLFNDYDQLITIFNEKDTPLEIAMEFIPVTIYKPKR